MPIFEEIVYTGKTQKGNEYVIARDGETGKEAAVFGKSVQTVREAVASFTNGQPVTLPGQIEANGTGPNGEDRWKWSHPEEPKGGRREDPLAKLVGIAHHQAIELVFSKRPPEDERKLSEFWTSARPHIKKMAAEIARDQLELVKELKG